MEKSDNRSSRMELAGLFGPDVFVVGGHASYETIVHFGTSTRAYAGAARRHVHLATVLLRPPSVHRPDRRQARHAHILQIGLRLAIAQADARPGQTD